MVATRTLYQMTGTIIGRQWACCLDAASEHGGHSTGRGRVLSCQSEANPDQMRSDSVCTLLHVARDVATFRTGPKADLATVADADRFAVIL